MNRCVGVVALFLFAGVDITSSQDTGKREAWFLQDGISSFHLAAQETFAYLHQLIGAPFTSINRGRERTRCYNDPPIGCFSNAYPYNNTMAVPHSIERMNLHYKHYVGNESQRFFWRNAKQAMQEKFRTDLKTCVIVHGWLEHTFKEWLVDLTQELIKKEPMNIIVVDWERGARVNRYLQAIANGRVVGAMVGLFLKDLQSMGADLSTFHLIGNSLGCHICGHIGAAVPGVGRISAMDPSGRAMENTPPEARLDPTDATVVDVIHTDGSKKLGFGTLQPLGTIDFYANGGYDQPGCAKSRVAILFAMVFRNIGFNKCSHTRANVLFIKSINDCEIKADPCDSLDDAVEKNCASCNQNNSTSCTEFGFNLVPNTTGIFHFLTEEEIVC